MKHTYTTNDGRILIADGGEEEGGGSEGEDEPTLTEVKESIDSATDRMEDIHETVKSVESTQETFEERLDAHEEDIQTFKETLDTGEGDEGDPEGDEGDPEGPSGLAEERAREIVSEEMDERLTDVATVDDIEQSQEKFLAKFAGLNPDDLPEDEDERTEVLRKAVHETERPNGGSSTVESEEVAKRDEETGEVMFSEGIVAGIGGED